MGAAQSGGIEIGGSSMGYQVLRVYPNSPGSLAGLKAYFDFIVAIGDKRFNKEDGSLREILKASVDQKLKMIVFNTRSKTAREVEIAPNTSWGGSGLLGVSIKHSSFDRADERVWHVVEVDPGSPAHQAGFKASEDYVIGSDSILQENDDLYNLIETHEGKALKLFVYNIKTDNCREVLCHPNSKWGGRGYLGCEFGHGLLHRIPQADDIQNGTGQSSSAPITTTTTTTVIGSAPNAATPAGDTRQAPSMSSMQNIAKPQEQLQSMASNPYAFQKQTSMQNRPTQPGYQLFQQALFDNRGQSPGQQQQSQSNETKSLPPPPQVPQTFAQLANAQYQAQQQEQHREQQQTQQRVPAAQQATDRPYQPPMVSQQLPSSPPAQDVGFNYQQGPPQQYPPVQPMSYDNYGHNHQSHQAPPPFQQTSPPPQTTPSPNQANPNNQAGQTSAGHTEQSTGQQGGPSLSPPPQAPPSHSQPPPAQQYPAPYQYFASQPGSNEPPPPPPPPQQPQQQQQQQQPQQQQQLYSFSQLPSLQQLPPMYPPPPPAPPTGQHQSPPPPSPAKDDGTQPPPPAQTQFNQVPNQQV